MIFEELYNEYLLEVKSSLKPLSIKKIENTVDIHILSFFRKKIVPFSVHDINIWKVQLKENNYSDTYIRSIFVILSTILNYGFRVYGIPNTMHRCKNFKRTRAEFEPNIYSLEQFLKYLSVIQDTQDRLIFSILFFCGLRKGELLALTWNDFYIDKLIINKTLTKGVLYSPKTLSSFRNVYLPAFLIEELKKYKIRSKGEKFIFSIKETSLDRHNRAYAKLSNLPRIRIHDFRHSHVTYLVYKGLTPNEICSRTGHKDKTMIYNRYSHLLENKQKNIVNVINKDLVELK